MNVSIKGCAFNGSGDPLHLSERILVTIQLEGSNRVFEARGQVVRQSGELVAVEYLLVEPEAEVLLRNYFRERLRNMQS